jgi:hypothetical protein
MNPGCLLIIPSSCLQRIVSKALRGAFTSLYTKGKSRNKAKNEKDLKAEGNMTSSRVEGTTITIRPLSQVPPIEHDSDVIRQFETRRESINGHLKKYFECIGHEESQKDLPGLYARPLRPRGSEADQSARLSQTNAITDLVKLDDILGQIKQQERPYIKAISPLIVAWYVSFSC